MSKMRPHADGGEHEDDPRAVPNAVLALEGAAPVAGARDGGQGLQGWEAFHPPKSATVPLGTEWACPQVLCLVP